MEIKYIKSVIAVSEYLSFSKAAEAIPCAQSSISRQIKAVEAELGRSLFERNFSYGKVEITPFGREAIPILEQIYKQYEAVEKLALKKEVKNAIKYRIGLYRGPFNSATKAKLASELYLKLPDISVTFDEVKMSNLKEELNRGSKDAIIFFKAFMKNMDDRVLKASDDRFERRILFKRKPCIVLPESHPLAKADEISFEQLRDETFVLYYNPFDEGLRKFDVPMDGFVQSCLNYGYTPKIETLPEDVYADIRDASVKKHGWLYPTFAVGDMNLGEGVVAVPVADPMFYAVYYMESNKNLPGISDRVAKAIKKALIKGDSSVIM